MNSATSEGFQAYTFLFSDIEGSTRLWEQLPEPMRLALREHDLRLNQAFAKHQGEVFKTIGDAFCVAFSQGDSALAAALEVQQSLRELLVAPGHPIRVRISVHTGLAESRSGDYFGPALNRTARQLGVAYGGQVLVSQTTALMVGNLLPQGATLRSLGKHRLKDLEQPEIIYQLGFPGLQEEFPPLRSLVAVPNNLPVELSAFLGRESARASVKTLLDSHRLVTLVGPGGIGKTRLALQSAAEQMERFPEGTFFLDLALLSDPKLVPQMLLTTLGLVEIPGRAILELLVEYLQTRRLLLIWDNVEHLLDGCATLIGNLLQACPPLVILTTSREPLGIRGEQVWRVPSLERDEATQFFVERARLHQSGFVATPEALASIGRICRRLDRIPLALELAAARVRVLSPQQIEARLEDMFRLLTGTNRRALPRQQTLRALIDWSYGLLNDSERLLLRRLSVFIGGWTLDAAEAICADDSLDSLEIFELLTALVEKSLVVVEEEGTEYRYRLLEILRQYSWERLGNEEPPEQVERLQRAHGQWYSELTAAAVTELHGPQQGLWIKRLEKEHENLRSAQDSGGAATAAISANLFGFWKLRGYLTEGRRRLTWALEHYAQGDPKLRMRLLTAAAQFAGEQGDFLEATQLQKECLALAQQLGIHREAGRALVQLGLFAVPQGQLESARAYYAEGIQAFRELDELQGVAWALNIAGLLERQQGHLESANEHFQESLALQRKLGSPENVAACLSNLGQLAQDQEEFRKATSLYEEVLQISKELGNTMSIATALHNLGVVARYGQELPRSLSLLREAVALERALGNPRLLSATLIELGAALIAQGARQEAVDALAESGALVRKHRFPLDATELLELWASLRLHAGETAQAARLLSSAEALRMQLGKARSPRAQQEFERLQAALENTDRPAPEDWASLLREEEAQVLQHA